MSQRPTLPEHHKLHLRAHFGFTRVPFCKNLWPSEMFDSRSQREVAQGLRLWTEVKGIACVTGPSGVGKSVTVRRFVHGLDEARFRVLHLTAVPATPHGFLRAVNRVLGLQMRSHTTDLFDQAHAHLTGKTDDQAPHPILVIDDAEGLRAELLDLLRRLTAYALDAEDRFSVLLAGTDDLLRVFRDPLLEPLRTRIGYAQPLRPYSLEDTRNYVTFHLTRADVRADLFSEDAVRKLFHASQGRPRSINQLALQTLIQAAVQGRDNIDGAFVAAQIAAHPLYEATAATS
jgi:type II secretory pathway predicted ATPase ExeA